MMLSGKTWKVNLEVPGQAPHRYCFQTLFAVARPRSRTCRERRQRQRQRSLSVTCFIAVDFGTIFVASLERAVPAFSKPAREAGSGRTCPGTGSRLAPKDKIGALREFGALCRAVCHGGLGSVALWRGGRRVRAAPSMDWSSEAVR